MSEPTTPSQAFRDAAAAYTSDLCIQSEELRELGTPAQLGALYGALAKAQGEFEPIGKSKHVFIRSQKGNYEFDYAPISEIRRCTVPAMAKHGLALLQPITKVGGRARITTIIAHEGGGRLVSVLEHESPQSVKDYGGATTYLARYAMQRLLSIEGDVDLDDQPEASRGESAAESKPRPVNGTSQRPAQLDEPALRDAIRKELMRLQVPVPQQIELAERVGGAKPQAMTTAQLQTFLGKLQAAKSAEEVAA